MESTAARKLPEEFLQSRGTPIERALWVVHRHWKNYPAGEQRQLAQALVALLEPLLGAPPDTVPENLREECARMVNLWEERWAANGRVIPIGVPESRRVGRRGRSLDPLSAPPPQRAVKFVS